MFRTVVVLLAVVVLVVEAKGARRVRPRQRTTTPAQQDPCTVALSVCSLSLIVAYGPYIQEAQQGPEAAEQAFMRLVAGLNEQTITEHCSTLTSIAECALRAVESDACSGKQEIRQFLPDAYRAKGILDYTCQPENVRVLAANIPCFTNHQMINSLDACPQQVQTSLLQAYPDFETASCSAIRASLRGLVLGCLTEKIEAASACRSARSNGGTHLAQTVAGRVWDMVSPNVKICPQNSRPLADLIAVHKKFFEDIYTYNL